MDIEDFINRSDILVHFEDLMYSEYFYWFHPFRLSGRWK